MDLELREDMAAQHRTWAFERFGWACLLLVLIAAMVGLFGGGVLGAASASSPDGSLRLEYPRFLRVESPERLHITIAPPRSTSGRFSLWVDAAYLEHVSLEHVTPEPERTLAGSERVTFEFAWDGAAGRVPIALDLVAEESGLLRGRIGTDTGATEFRQFVYP